jgi:hypothetical protein
MVGGREVEPPGGDAGGPVHEDRCFMRVFANSILSLWCAFWALWMGGWYFTLTWRMFSGGLHVGMVAFVFWPRGVDMVHRSPCLLGDSRSADCSPVEQKEDPSRLGLGRRSGAHRACCPVRAPHSLGGRFLSNRLWRRIRLRAHTTFPLTFPPYRGRSGTSLLPPADAPAVSHGE